MSSVEGPAEYKNIYFAPAETDGYYFLFANVITLFSWNLMLFTKEENHHVL